MKAAPQHAPLLRLHSGQPAERSAFDPTTQRGRYNLARTTLLVMLCVLLLEMLYVPGLGRVMLRSDMVSVLGLGLLLALSAALPLTRWLSLCAAAFALQSALDLSGALLHHHLPVGMAVWAPLWLLELPLLLGSVRGVLAVLGLALVFTGVFCLHLNSVMPLWHSHLLLGWLSWLGSSGLFAVIGYGVACFLEGVGRNQAMTQQALSSTQYDALTQVLGRAAAEEELLRSVLRANSQRMPLSLIVCDIDHFKKVNDQYGHSKGDEVLRAVAQRLQRSSIPIGAQVGRWGGEEFVIILPRYSREDAVNVAQRIRQDIAQHKLAGLRVTMSLGVATYRPGEEPDALFERADQAAYQAKRDGRNRVRSWSA